MNLNTYSMENFIKLSVINFYTQIWSKINHMKELLFDAYKLNVLAILCIR